MGWNQKPYTKIYQTNRNSNAQRADMTLLFLGRVTFNSTGLLPAEHRLMCDPFLRQLRLCGTSWGFAFFFSWGGGNNHFWLVDSNLKTNKTIKFVGVKISNRLDFFLKKKWNHRLRVEFQRSGLWFAVGRPPGCFSLIPVHPESAWWLSNCNERKHGKSYRFTCLTCMYPYVLVKSCQYALSLPPSWSTCLFGFFQFEALLCLVFVPV